jgi:hypothetical protein
MLGGVAQPGDRQEILGKLSIPCVALLSLYSPNCVEGLFSEVPPRPDPMRQGFLCRVSEMRSLMYIRLR